MPQDEFKGLLSPTETRPRAASPGLAPIIKDAFGLQTLLVFGALIQMTLFTVFPPYLAIIPATLLALNALATTGFQVLAHPSNRFMCPIIPGRTSAQLPDYQTGRHGRDPASQPVVVFHFGARFNHPLGALAPGARETLSRAVAMIRELSSSAGYARYGLLGMQRYRGDDGPSSNALLLVMYFRDLEGLRRFAHDETHRRAWDWLARSGHGHISAFHETFVVERGSWETVYLDCEPMLLGKAAVKADREDGKEEWVPTLVSADHPSLKSMAKRMGREGT